MAFSWRTLLGGTFECGVITLNNSGVLEVILKLQDAYWPCYLFLKPEYRSTRLSLALQDETQASYYRQWQNTEHNYMFTSQSIPLVVALLVGCLITDAKANERCVQDNLKDGYSLESKIISRLVNADVILLGESHDNLDHRRIQTEIIQNLIDAGRRPAIYFEMLTDQEESAHERFLQASSSTPSESSGSRDSERQDVLQWEKRGWNNWEAYARIFRLADQYALPVRHADLSVELMRNVRRFGLLAVPKELRVRLFEILTEPELRELLERLQNSVAGSHRLEPNSPGIAGLVQAQMTRDAYMALRISQAQPPAVLVAGVEHARNDRGVPFHLKLRSPHLNVVSVALPEAPLHEQCLGGQDSTSFDFALIGVPPN
jgi:uncharacterized iron-regulated protein